MMTRWRDDHGAATVEFALTLPLLMCLILGVITGGITLNQKIAVTNGVREGSRFGATLSVDHGTFTAILCTTAFHHFPRPRDTIAEMTRVLSPRGRVVIADANRRHPAVFVPWPYCFLSQSRRSGVVGGPSALTCSSHSFERRIVASASTYGVRYRACRVRPPPPLPGHPRNGHH